MTLSTFFSLSSSLFLGVALVACGGDGSTAGAALTPETGGSDAAVADTTGAEDTPAVDTTQEDAGAVDASTAEPCERTQTVVTFETADGVTLTADYLPAVETGAGAVVLFHMIPPFNDRSTYPQRVINAFAELGVAVLNVDRRGAGDSGGDAEAAYEGEGGRLDMEAAVSFLVDPEGACPADPAALMLVGASNGTTSVMDYTVGHDAALPAPAAIAWLSPGDYTENQNALADHRDQLDALPILWVFPDNEPYSTRYQPGATPWRFVELRDGEHGTNNFDDGSGEREQLGALLDWAAAAIVTP